MENKNKALILASILTAGAALAHIGCIVFGADWYRFFGAGEEMAMMSEQGLAYPTIVTSIIVFVLSCWSLYGLSGAKVIPRLPFLHLVLALISSIFILRAVTFYWLMAAIPENSLTFWLVSSFICFVIGGLFAFGTWQSYSQYSTEQETIHDV